MTNTLIASALASVVLVAFYAPALRAADIECHANKRYHVASETYSDDAGARFAITDLHGGAAPKRCIFDAAAADFLIGTKGDPLWFDTLAGRFLVLRRSTGPRGDLVVYDLDSRKPVLDVAADDYGLDGETLRYWERTAEGTASTCPAFAEHQANGMGSVIAVEKTLDLATMMGKATGNSRCDATQ
jgi:hypothetical protein